MSLRRKACTSGMSDVVVVVVVAAVVVDVVAVVEALLAPNI